MKVSGAVMFWARYIEVGRQNVQNEHVLLFIYVFTVTYLKCQDNCNI